MKVLCAIFDNKAEIFQAPHVMKNSAEFIRAVQTEAKNPQSMFHQYPADYELHLIGEWDETNAITSTTHKRLGSVLDLCPLK